MHFSSCPSGRLDKALAQLTPDLSRARLQALIAEGAVTVNGAPVTQPAFRLRGGETLALTVPEAREAEPQAQSLPLDILYEDDHLLVVNKPVGMVVHPAAGSPDGTLVNALLAHCGGSLSGIGGVKRPGIVHRLDKDTSGLMVVAKTDAAHQGLSAQFADRTLSRRYQALVWGAPQPPSGTIDAAIGRSPRNRKKMAVRDEALRRQLFYGEDVETEADDPESSDDIGGASTPQTGARHAVTHYETLQSFGLAAAHVACMLETGRTHQIRVHMAHIGHGVIGDPVYGSGKGLQKRLEEMARRKAVILPSPLIARQALHAAEIEFIHPHSGKPMHFEATLPADMDALLTILRKL